MDRVAVRWAVGVVLLASVACRSMAGPAPPRSEREPSHQGLVAFTTQRHGEPMPTVAVIPAAGGKVTRLHEGRDATWSPDGEEIAFACHPGICTMRPDGSEVTRLTRPRGGAIDESPAWSATGRIAFTRSYMDGVRGPDILVVPEDGGTPKLLIEAGSNHSPTWSPDGRGLALIRGLGRRLEAPHGGFQLWTMSASGRELRRLTTKGNAWSPEWSPNSDEIVFDEASIVWIIPAEGGEPRPLEPATAGTHPDVGAFATWSPDGSHLAYTCERGKFDDHDLCIMNTDGTGRVTLLNTPANEASPAWQRDG
jgi:Tol biopolymer transport system component